MAPDASRIVGRVLDELIERARLRPETIVDEARKHGLPVTGTQPHEQLASLRLCDPATLDPLAASFISGHLLAAGVQGFVTNVGGALTLPVAMSADVVGTLALLVRTTSGVMGSYGFESETQDGAAQLRVGLLIAAGVNRLTVGGTDLLARRLVQRLGLRFRPRRLARAVPLVGGAIGAGVNMGIVRTMGRRAQGHYRALLVEWQANQTWLAPPTVAGELGP